MACRAAPAAACLAFAAAWLALAALPAAANVLVGGTRVILREVDREASISIKNTGKRPFIVQAWLDIADGDKSRVPLFASPPLSRLDAGKENLLRIMRVPGDLPADRESLFWLNVKEIPERAAEENALQIAMRTRIKVFYRPQKLPGTSYEAPAQLTWQLVQAPGSAPMLRVTNPSAYHVTFYQIDVNGRELDFDTRMIPPHDEVRYALKDIDASQVEVVFSTLNDYGGQTTPMPLHVGTGAPVTAAEGSSPAAAVAASVAAPSGASGAAPVAAPAPEAK